MANGAPQLQPNQAEPFLQQYQKDVTDLRALQEKFREKAQAYASPTNTGTVNEAVDAYGKRNTEMLEAHEAVQQKITQMQAQYETYGIPKEDPAKVGLINQQVGFLKRLEELKQQAKTSLDAQNKNETDATKKQNNQGLIDYANQTNQGKFTSLSQAKIKEKKPDDMLVSEYQTMWGITMGHDVHYAQRKHRLSLKGKGRVSEYDINKRWGWNLQYGQFGVETLGIQGEFDVFNQFLANVVGAPSLVRLGGREKLGQFAVTRTEYVDKNGAPLTYNNQRIYGPAHTLTVQQVSIYGGYGSIAKWVFSSNEKARYLQAGYTVGAFLSSHVNNPAILLDRDKIQADTTLSAEAKKELLDAQADAERQAKEFMEKGINVTELAPGYAGMDFYYQMQAMSMITGIPFNKNGPTLQEMLQKQISGAAHYKPHLRMMAEYALWQVEKRGDSMREAAYRKQVEHTMETQEYKNLLAFAVVGRLEKQFENDKDYNSFKAKFDKDHPALFEADGKTIKDPKAYSLAFAKALEKKYPNEYKAVAAQVQTPGSAEHNELLKNGAGAKFTGENDWYRRLKYDSGVSMSNEQTGATPGAAPAPVPPVTSPSPPVSPPVSPPASPRPSDPALDITAASGAAPAASGTGPAALTISPSDPVAAAANNLKKDLDLVVGSDPAASSGGPAPSGNTSRPVTIVGSVASSNSNDKKTSTPTNRS